MANLFVIHGPNLNMLGTREPQHYGSDSLQAINEQLQINAAELGHQLKCSQSNSEAELIELVQNNKSDLIIINPAAYTHTSIALRDALLSIGTPFIEVHLSNIYSREVFRQHSYFSDIAIGVISGFGVNSYQLALNAAHQYLTQQETVHGHS